MGQMGQRETLVDRIETEAPFGTLMCLSGSRPKPQGSGLHGEEMAHYRPPIIRRQTTLLLSS